MYFGTHKSLGFYWNLLPKSFAIFRKIVKTSKTVFKTLPTNLYLTNLKSGIENKILLEHFFTLSMVKYLDNIILDF